jgi:hypothetical protein
VTTYHESAAEHLMDAMLREPEGVQILADTRTLLRNRQMPLDYVDVIGQSDPRGGVWPMEQVAAFLKVHASLNSGQYARVDLDLLEAPSSDADRVTNAAVIGDLPDPFRAWLNPDQNCNPNGDGALWWRDVITARRSTGLGVVDDDGATVAVFGDQLVRANPDGGIPLEVGSTKASVTMTHLARCKGVARWPYGSTVMTILLDTAWFGSPPGTQESLRGL